MGKNKCCGYSDVHQFDKTQHYQKHIRRSRWMVERMLGWLAKCPIIKTRWRKKKPENQIDSFKFACADILLNLIYG